MEGAASRQAQTNVFRLGSLTGPFKMLNLLSAIMLRKAFWEKHRDTQLNIRQQKMIATLLDDFFGSLTTSKWAKMTKSSTDTALRDIRDLVEKGILEQTAGGRRSAGYMLLTK